MDVIFTLSHFLGCCFFLFKQKTAYEMRISDGSSDVWSSDLSIIVVAALFEWTEDAESRFVHQHIQPPAQQANRLFDRRHGLIRMVDVKRNNKGAPRCPGLYLLLQRHVAQRADHDVTAVKGRIHQATAKASGNAGYEPGFRSLAEIGR